MRIDVNLTKRKLIVRKGSDEKDINFNEVLLEADIVSGCEGYETPSGKFKAGKFIKDKTNTVYGPSPWSKDPWGNPYGPYFLQIVNQNGVYTSYGIHGTRGYSGVLGSFDKPPIPKWMLSVFIEEDAAKFSYCSHGCIRLSNNNITKLFSIVTEFRTATNIKIPIYITKE